MPCNLSSAGRLSILLWFALLAACSEPAQLTSGMAAPAFSLERLDGSRADFPAAYRGKVVAVRFWADWCPFCKDEMDALEPLFRRYEAEGLRILAVNVRQDRATAQAFIDKLSISYEVLLDHEGDVARRYGVSGLPTTVFVDAAGVVRARIIGESTPETFETLLHELLPPSPHDR